MIRVALWDDLRQLDATMRAVVRLLFDDEGVWVIEQDQKGEKDVIG